MMIDDIDFMNEGLAFVFFLSFKSQKDLLSKQCVQRD